MPLPKSVPNQWLNNADMVNLVLFNETRTLDFFCNVEYIKFQGIAGGIPSGSLCAIDWNGQMLYYDSGYKGGKPRFFQALDLKTFKFKKANADFMPNSQNASYLHADYSLTVRGKSKFYGSILPAPDLMNDEDFLDSDLAVVYRIITDTILKLGYWVLNHRINDLEGFNEGARQMFGNGVTILNHELTLPEDRLSAYHSYLNYCQEAFTREGVTKHFV